MRRFVIVRVLVILGFMAVVLSFYWLVPKQAGGDRPNGAINPHATTSLSFNSGEGVVEMEYNGNILRFAISGAEAKDVDVRLLPSLRFKDDQVDATIQVTIKTDPPPVLTKDAYEKIQNGMTYPQVGEVLGGAMTKGQMSDGFSSKLELIQGKRRIDLNFVNGKVTDKSARDLD